MSEPTLNQQFVRYLEELEGTPGLELAIFTTRTFHRLCNNNPLNILHKVVEHGSAEYFQYCLDVVPPEFVFHPNDFLRTPLEGAILMDNEDIVDLLIERRPPQDELEKMVISSLFFGREEHAKTFLMNGADLDRKVTLTAAKYFSLLAFIYGLKEDALTANYAFIIVSYFWLACEIVGLSESMTIALFTECIGGNNIETRKDALEELISYVGLISTSEVTLKLQNILSTEKVGCASLTIMEWIMFYPKIYVCNLASRIGLWKKKRRDYRVSTLGHVDTIYEEMEKVYTVMPKFRRLFKHGFGSEFEEDVRKPISIEHFLPLVTKFKNKFNIQDTEESIISQLGDITNAVGEHKVTTLVENKCCNRNLLVIEVPETWNFSCRCPYCVDKILMNYLFDWNRYLFVYIPDVVVGAKLPVYVTNEIIMKDVMKYIE